MHATLQNKTISTTAPKAGEDDGTGTGECNSATNNLKECNG